MKTFLEKILYILFISLIVSACSDEEVANWNGEVEEGTPVVLSLPYDVSIPKVISRATAEEESKLYDLTIFIFNEAGKLKGYKKIESGLAENGTTGSVTIETTTGKSYLYAVANTSTTLYSAIGMPSTDGEFANFTLDDLKEMQFKRNKGIDITDGRFLMSGMANNGELCELTKSADGKGMISSPADADSKIIKLRRIVSKINFRFKVDDEAKKTFVVKRYDIYNIPQQGYVIDRGVQEATSGIAGNRYDAVTNLQNFSQDEKNLINVYLPENNESVNKNGESVSQSERETNSYAPNGDKSFTKAPDYATYIVVYGDFTRTNADGRTDRYADVNYTIHLGDFNETNWNNYDNERNCKYAYTITIKDVDNIVVEAEKEGDPQPGAEGIVIDYTNGKNFLLDSHYEDCVMQFKQSDIQKLIAGGKGYIFQIETIDGLSESFTVNSATWDESVLNNVDYKWVTFAKGGTYDDNNEKGGTPLSYTETNGQTMYTVPELLKYLYSIADDNSQWTDKGNTLTFTCFVDENYYPDRKWSEYTNVKPRILYIANNVNMSKDQHSIHAEVAYGVKQRTIQTFYNRDKAENEDFVAYGCETIDETTPTPNQYQYDSNLEISSVWDGREAMVKTVKAMFEGNWQPVDDYSYNKHMAVVACMSRNRDLNKDGKITQDEVRWYLPSYPQYSGLWLGERSIATEAALFTGSTSELSLTEGNKGYMHYFTNTKNKEVFWGEEGSCFGNIRNDSYINYIRCIRNLKSNDDGVEPKETSLEANTVIIADKYYEYDPKTRTFNLENMDSKALLDNPQVQEFGNHHERDNNINAPYISFIVDTENLRNDVTIENVVTGKVDCSKRRNADPGNNWRVPNQRELSLMVLEQEHLKLQRNDPEGTFCRTAFSNGPYRYSYGYTTQLRLYSLKGGNGGYPGLKGWIRCVRDKSNK